MYKSVLKEVTNTTNQNAKILSQLHQKPKRDKKDETPVFQNFVPNYTHQADLLYLPTAKYGYKMLLVVVDNHTHKFDAEPLKEKSSEYVAKAFKRLYDRFPLPKRIEVDSGTEFKGEVHTFFKNKNIDIRTAPTARHRMQGLVEARNGVIGKMMMFILDSNELKTGKTSKDGYKSEKEFRHLIKLLNEKNTYKPMTDDMQSNIRVTDNNKNILPQGTEVRVELDYPVDVAKEKRQYGKFRTGDIRFSKEVKPIVWNVLQPNQPPMYKVEGENHLRTRNQLQVIKQPNWA
jgi:hypothetical protein